MHHGVLGLMLATGAKDDIACFGYFAEFLLGLCSGSAVLRSHAVGMIAERELAVGLSHLVVCGCLGDAEGSVGFLEGDIDVGLPGMFVSLVAIVDGAAIGEVDGGTAKGRVEECAQDEAKEESPPSADAPADDGEQEFEAKETGHRRGKLKVES